MKIIIVGDWRYYIYEKSFAEELNRLGVRTIGFCIDDYFKGFTGKIERILPLPGPSLIRINHDLINVVKNESPDVLLGWRLTHVLPSTLKVIRSLGVTLVSYNNDDPFGPKAHGNVPWHHHALWFWYIKCLSFYDLSLFYRRVNVNEASRYGARNVDVLLPYFIPDKDMAVNLSVADTFLYSCDVVFIGHFENDDRGKYIKSLVRDGYKLRLYGDKYWTRDVLGDCYDHLKPIRWLDENEYVKAICGAEVCLVFLSKLNRDTYTRRCFEIPACGRTMLCERTYDMINFFKEDEEACFFSSYDELIAKLNMLLKNPALNKKIALAGQRRVWTDHHDLSSRAQEFLAKIKRFNLK